MTSIESISLLVSCEGCGQPLPLAKRRTFRTKRPCCGAKACVNAIARVRVREATERAQRREAVMLDALRLIAAMECVDVCAHFARAKRAAQHALAAAEYR